MRAATLQDVADLSGVSRGTASRALTGDGRVSPETRARVSAAAAELRYTTNSVARNLRRARAGSIGLWMPRDLRFMAYYMNFAFGVAESTHDRELTVTLIPGDYPAAKARALHVDGFVMADVDTEDDLAQAILSSGRLVVASEMVPEGMPQPTTTIAADHAGATGSLLERLRASGARSIAVLSPALTQVWLRTVDETASAWSAATGIPVVTVRLQGMPSATELDRVVRELLAARPDVDAVVCVPEGIGVGVLSILRELGRAVPRDIQVVSYVDSPTLPIVQPPISALDLRPREAGARAGRTLISLIENPVGNAPAGHVELMDVVYVERASTRAVSG